MATGVYHFIPLTLWSRFYCRLDTKLLHIMEFGRVIDPFVKTFFICGLSCYPSFDEFLVDKIKGNRYTNYIPTVGLVLLIIIASISNCIDLHEKETTVIINILINTTGESIIVFVTAMQIFVEPSSFSDIYSRIDYIERLMQRKLSWDPTVFKRRFMRNIHIIFILYVVPNAYTFYSQNIALSILIAQAVLRAIVFMALLQAFFYVDLLGHMLHCFTRHVEQRAADATPGHRQSITYRSRGAKQLIDELFKFKLLHFNLWEISEKVNQLFGWTVSVIFMQYFLTAIMNVHYAYRMLMIQPLSWTDLIRPITFLGCSSIYTTMFVNSCYRCSEHKGELIENIEKLTFYAREADGTLYFAKRELLSQIKSLHFTFVGRNFFVINRESLGEVSSRLTFLHL